MKFGESVADGIKRRMAEQDQARRARTRLYVRIAVLSAAAGAAVMAVALASTLGGAH